MCFFQAQDRIGKLQDIYCKYLLSYDLLPQVKSFSRNRIMILIFTGQTSLVNIIGDELLLNFGAKFQR